MPQSTSSQPSSVITLATIASHLGVSRSTVSNAYNHPDQLSSTLRTRILSAAEELGYTGPDPVARRLRQGHAGAIGVLFSEPLKYAFVDPACTLFLQGIATAGQEADSGMLLIPARPYERGAEVVQNAIVDGFVLYSIQPGHPFVDAALRRRLPVVCVDQTQIGGVSWVGIDDRAAARESARHLVELGHRRIAVLVYALGPSFGSTAEEPKELEGPCPSVSWLRLEGYSDALRSAGLDWNSVTIHECKRNTPEDGANGLRALMQSENPPTAILCTSDLLALGAMKEAETVGINIPDKLSVMGINDIPEAETAGLTTIRQPLAEKGFEAAKLLLEGHADPQESVHLDYQMIIRSSTGPAPL